jgi:S1-C subfamily serine protease
MNNRRIWTILGLAALGVALIALPGSSARKQEPHSPTPQQVEAELGALQVRVEYPFAWQEPDSARNLVEAVSDGDDVQVVLGHGGSWLGVGVSEVTTSKVKELKLPAERGALVGKIVPDSPAVKAGLKENDVILEINGTRVEGTEQFRRMIREIPAGRTAQLTVWRDGRSQTIAVTLAKSENKHALPLVGATPGAFAFQMPDLPEVRELPDSGGMRTFAFSMSGRARLGIDAEDLDGDFGNYLGAPDGEGILVRNVFPDSPAAKAGIKAGDVIISLSGERIRSIGELREKMIAQKDAKSVKLGLLRNKNEMSVTVELPEAASGHKAHISQRTSI